MIELNLSAIEALEIFKPLAIFAGGMAIYLIFIFKFYKFLLPQNSQFLWLPHDILSAVSNQWNTLAEK